MTDQAKAAAEFVAWAMMEGPWSGGSIDGDVLQDKAEELGLIEKTQYDPEKHGPNDCDAEPGDDWYVLSRWVTQALYGAEQLKGGVE